MSVDDLVKAAVTRNEGVINSTGSLSVNTGKYTGRSPDDRFIVYDDKTRNTIDWGKINHQFASDKFEKILERKIHLLLLPKKISDEFFNNLINGIVLYGAIRK